MQDEKQKDMLDNAAEDNTENNPAAYITPAGTDTADAAPEAQTDTVKTKKPVKGWRKALKIIGNTLFALLLISIAVMAFFIVRSKISGTPPTVADHYLFIVLSGSMEPEFATGSMVFVKPVDPEDIKTGDIVTFRGFAGSDQLTTHRVMGINTDEDGQMWLVTKGDANSSADPDPIPVRNVVGRVSGWVPLLGYLMSFIQTRQGLMAFILIPGALLIGYEVYGLITKASELKKSKNKKADGTKAE